jgi:hypothetical protein
MLYAGSRTGLRIRKRDGMTFLRSGGHAPTEIARARNMLHARMRTVISSIINVNRQSH